MIKGNTLVFIKTSSEDKGERRLQDVFKTSSSRRMFAGLFVCKSFSIISMMHYHVNSSSSETNILYFHSQKDFYLGNSLLYFTKEISNLDHDILSFSFGFLCSHNNRDSYFFWRFNSSRCIYVNSASIFKTF